MERFKNRVGTEFVGKPPDSATRMYSFVEIVAGSGFDGEFLYATRWELPSLFVSLPSLRLSLPLSFCPLILCLSFSLFFPLCR